ncbi:MAG TPA: RidA family protein [Solirubrobacteraceae bacterium]|nr:RidA family protein [Solirubrobacteraceae bacterium]
MPDYKVIPNPTNFHPFSLAAAGDEFVFITGLGGHGPSGEISDDVAEQARQAITNMEGLLVSVGSALSEIVYFRPMVTRREYAFEMDGVFRQMLPDPKPACAALLICELADPRMKMEIEAIAQRGARLSV